jgi:hypothetical protein
MTRGVVTLCNKQYGEYQLSHSKQQPRVSAHNSYLLTLLYIQCREYRLSAINHSGESIKKHKYLLEFSIKFEKYSDTVRGLGGANSWKTRDEKSPLTVPLWITFHGFFFSGDLFSVLKYWRSRGWFYETTFGFPQGRTTKWNMEANWKFLACVVLQYVCSVWDNACYWIIQQHALLFQRFELLTLLGRLQTTSSALFWTTGQVLIIF